jgi:uncharacterized protein YjbI with pentapeptide repeats
MARPWIRRIGWIAIVVVVVAALAVPVVFPSDTKAIATRIATTFRALPDLSVTALVIEIAVGAALAVIAAAWWLWWRLPKRQVHGLDIQIHDPKARADTEDNFRKTVGQALGGAAVLVGAVVAYLQFTQQQQASHDLLISNQVSKGFEQLASDKITERLGGIYALEGVMNTSTEYHQAVLEALCAFVRDSTTRQQITLTGLLQALFSAQRSGTDKANDRPPNDIQAALTVIGRRKPGEGYVDLTRAIIPNADLSGADLNGADLSGANLSRANLSRADLSRANLSGADLTGAYLTGAYLILTNLSGVDLTGANLPGAKLIRADLSSADLSGADLSGANLTAADLIRANLSRANLSRADLRYAHMTFRANLRGANLSDADLSSADLSGADLNGADLSGANLSGADLNKADLSDANLHGANLRGAYLSGAYLILTNLSGADLSDANLVQEHLDQACGKPKALPPGLNSDKLKPCP